MKTYLADIIPRIQRFSRRLDNLTKLNNQHWVSINGLTGVKRVFLFGSNGELDVYENGVETDTGTWRLLENNSIQIKFKNRPGLLLKHGFFDENILALKVDSSDTYAFFVNENKYHTELNNINDILKFLEDRYIENKGIDTGHRNTINKNAPYSYNVIDKKKRFSLELGNHWTFEIVFGSGIKGFVHWGCSSTRYFYINKSSEIIYCKDLEDAAFKVHQHLISQNNR